MSLAREPTAGFSEKTFLLLFALADIQPLSSLVLPERPQASQLPT